VFIADLLTRPRRVSNAIVIRGRQIKKALMLVLESSTMTCGGPAYSIAAQSTPDALLVVVVVVVVVYSPALTENDCRKEI